MFRWRSLDFHTIHMKNGCGILLSCSSLLFVPSLWGLATVGDLEESMPYLLLFVGITFIWSSYWNTIQSRHLLLDSRYIFWDTSGFHTGWKEHSHGRTTLQSCNTRSWICNIQLKSLSSYIYGKIYTTWLWFLAVIIFFFSACLNCRQMPFFIN